MYFDNDLAVWRDFDGLAIVSSRSAYAAIRIVARKSQEHVIKSGSIIISPKLRYAIAALVGICFDILFFWRFLPYSQRLRGGPSGAWILLIALAAGFFIAARPLTTWLAMFAGFTMANIVLIVVDCWKDPTNHNLWPLEIVMIGVLTAPSALGAILSKILSRST